MHTCPAPIALLNQWLEEFPSTNGKYGHILLEENQPRGAGIATGLRAYFESAHLDAREHFHAQIGMDLHPDAGTPGAHAEYPHCLAAVARRGLFGEVFAGLVTQGYSMVGGHQWAVPIFLFRYHADVEKYLFDLARDPTAVRTTWGRFGSDFLGLSLNGDGSVQRVISGEAKWRAQLNKSTVDVLMLGEKVDDPKGGSKKVHSGKGIWFELNRSPKVPHGLRQFQRLLEERDPNGHSAAILSIDKALLVQSQTAIPKTDLVVIVGNDVPSREAQHSLIPWETMPSEYKAGNDLQVVEIILKHGEALIDEIYSSLWT